jgi:protein involved in polysaccharide export with SLBB domain
MRDLYVFITDETKLERFGAALFRNSAAAADKAPLSVPVGPTTQVTVLATTGCGLRWGPHRNTFSVVDREGRVSIPEAGSVVVAGRTLGGQQTIKNARINRGVTVDVTLGKLRGARLCCGRREEPGRL